MIIETLIASIAAVVVAGTWFGTRFAARVIEQEAPEPHVDTAEQKRALADVERCMKYDSESGRAEVRAMLACRPHALPPDVRARAAAWCRE